MSTLQTHPAHSACIRYPASGRILKRCKEGRMTREEIIEVIRTTSENNRLSCEKAHDLAKNLNIPLREIGAICNELKIKIAACQLGCF
jgi:hypothetical protein